MLLFLSHLFGKKENVTTFKIAILRYATPRTTNLHYITCQKVNFSTHQLERLEYNVIVESNIRFLLSRHYVTLIEIEMEQSGNLLRIPILHICNWNWRLILREMIIHSKAVLFRIWTPKCWQFSNCFHWN